MPARPALIRQPRLRLSASSYDECPQPSRLGLRQRAPRGPPAGGGGGPTPATAPAPAAPPAHPRPSAGGQRARRPTHGNAGGGAACPRIAASVPVAERGGKPLPGSRARKSVIGPPIRGI